jgi:hypothetical protein
MVRLKFVFANHDGLIVEQEHEVKKSILEVKKELIAAWPEKLEAIDSTGFVRLICMGHDLQDHKTLEECRVPVFAHPTPVNVAVRPKDAPQAKSSKGGGKTATQRGSNNADEGQSNACLCTIM